MKPDYMTEIAAMQAYLARWKEKVESDSGGELKLDVELKIDVYTSK